MTDKLTIADYPMAEVRPERVKGARGKALDDITLASVVAGEVAMDDLRITPEAQWEIRRMALEMLRQLAPHAPVVFGDLWAEVQVTHPDWIAVPSAEEG